MDKTKKDNARFRSDAPVRKPLRQSVAELDQEILRLLVRRNNLLDKLRKNGRLDSTDEKFLRESWQNDVARVSRDPNLSGRFFALMQQLSFMPKPVETADGAGGGTSRRQAFNLSPASGEVIFETHGLVSTAQTCAWLYLAAAAGQKIRLENCLQNDAVVDCIRCLVEVGGSVTREDDNRILCRPGHPIGAPDKVIHVGSNKFLFYLLLAHYLGRPARVKFIGEADLALANFSVLSKLVPSLGGRITFAIPKSSSLPARVESPGMMPNSINVENDWPILLVEALLLAAPFYEKPIAINLANYANKAQVLAHILPIFKASGVRYNQQSGSINIMPDKLQIPVQPVLPLEPELAVFLLAFSSVRGGHAKLIGLWPDWPEANAAWTICQVPGWKREKDFIESNCQTALKEYVPAHTAADPDWLVPLQAAFSASTALQGGIGILPKSLLADANLEDFLLHAGVNLNQDGTVEAGVKYDGLAWNAPSAAWAMALAVTACARKTSEGIPLGNPGIVTQLWPQFWSFYNSLPTPRIKRTNPQEQKPEKNRRRIITSAVAIPPAITEEDWD